ncbi:response regulator transcription factor [Bosea lathyri]|uniref:Two component transcriptional regulator, winged helix family n=1 Tax=Bosea lathyri TaxID=1036778 RepID=A0A1H5SUP3_9HYPH|nr:response regulator transcription factor [Bosea lathyri]SEF53648.1 two component transcriptional regulator, winged helix family [Bosea lathyri]
MTHILIVEDETRLRKDLIDFLGLCGFSASGVATAQELRQALADGNSPDVIILDVGLPDGNGFELASQIREAHRCGIIMLTALGDSDDRIRGFESGADIYLVKHSTLREIEAAIRSLLRRSASLPNAANGNGDQWVLDGTNWMLVAPNHRSLKLTATEFAFMSVLCSCGGDICQRESLMETLARPKSNFGNRHLDAMVSRLRRKIEERTNLPAPIKVVYGVGYTFTATAAVQ